MIVLLLVILIILGGCRSLRRVVRGAVKDEKSALKVATELYTVTLNRLADMREAGQISDEEYQEIDHYRKVASKALDGWRLALEKEESPEKAIGRFYEALTYLVTEVEERSPKE